jgi:hypothetical protein
LSPLRIPWRFFIVLLVASLILPAASARAQGTAFAALTNPDTSKFPLITTLLDVFDDQGNFLTALQPADVDVLENGQQIKPDSLELLQTPLNFVLAINSGPALSVRDGLGKSRYDYLAAVLSNWVAARPSDSLDSMALVWNGGIVASRLVPAEWKTRFDNFDPALKTSSSSLEALGFALDAIQGEDAVPGVKKAILLVSPHLEKKDQANINSLITRAKQGGVRVSVWMTDSQAFLSNSGALALQDLALSTGGRYLTFTGKETLPDLEEWLSPLRHVYRLTYSSKIRAGGQQTLTAQVNAPSLVLTSPAVDFALDVQPPAAALLSPPIQIVRQNPNKPFEVESFLPNQQEISMLVEFPDKLPRPLKRTALFVDGQKIAENTSAPFDLFVWDISSYVVTGDHILRVEAEDSLGLTGESAEVPVQVTVILPPGGIAGLVMRNSVSITIAFVVLAAGILLGILFLGGRRGLATLAERRKARAAQIDPVTQPVFTIQGSPAPRTSAPFPWLRRKAPAPPAYFVKLTSDGAPASGDPIPLLGHELTFGTDPTQATTVLDDPSLSALHSRLRHTEGNIFLLMDQNTVAGTWVNYDSITKEGCVLKHGDVVNFGHLTYRFVLTKPPAASKPTITPYKDG